MKKNETTLQHFMAALMAASLAACGSSGGDSSDSSSGSSSKGGDDKEIVYWNIGTESPDKDVIDKAVEKFNSETKWISCNKRSNTERYLQRKTGCSNEFR